MRLPSAIAREASRHTCSSAARSPAPPSPTRYSPEMTFAFAAHRAVVDVDAGLGIVRVLDMATAQDVGKAMNPQQLEGQIEGGTCTASASR